MQNHEFLLLPVSQVPPFDIRQRFVREIEGVAMESYIDWMKSCYFITVTGHPAISLPLYWNQAGLPIGLQFAARFGDEATLIRLAAQLEQARPWFDRHPPR